MGTCISHSAAETEALGRRWGETAVAGMVIGMSGDLGAGKTQLVKGIAAGLGIESRVVSPTFALVNTYEGGRLPLNHLDLYRLEGQEQIMGAGLEGYFAPEGLTVVEWVERWFGRVPGENEAWEGSERPERFRMVWLEVVSESERRIRYEDFGI